MQLNDENYRRMQQGKGPGVPADDDEAVTQVESSHVGGLGRRYAPDARDRSHALTEAKLRTMTRQQTGARIRPWNLGPILNQGSTSECTVFAFAAFLQASPFPHTLAWARGEYTSRYTRAQRDDEWPGESYDGTSERAVLKTAKDDGLITEYLPVYEEDIAREWLRTRGGLLMGTDWFASMNTPGKDGYVTIDGPPGGGHETYLRWYYGPRHRKYPDSYEFVNSWGPSWGDAGLFRMKAEDFRYLVFSLNGDLWSPIETARKRKR